MSTSFQDQARQANAKKSTGPKTAKGKAISRENAVKHGLAGKGICLPVELQEAVEERRHGFGAKIDHDHALSLRYEDEIVLAAVRLDVARRARYLSITRRWDEDHEIEVLELAAKLPKDPKLVHRKLKRTVQGVTWLIEQLEEMLDILNEKGIFTTPQILLVLDLVGHPSKDRDLEFVPKDEPAARELLVDEIARLRSRLEDVLIPLEEEEKEAAMLGVPVNETRELTLLRRYERENVNKFFKLSKELELGLKKGPKLEAPRKPVPVGDAPPTEESCVDESSQDVNEDSVITEQNSTATKGAAPPRDEPGDPSPGWEGSQGPPRPLTRRGRPAQGPPKH